MSDPRIPAMKISAIICTHNREKYLGKAIESLLKQNFSGEYEVLVIDNASTDRTREIVEFHQTECQTEARLRYACEPMLGLSVARNTGAKLARSEILAYLDDDAIASPDWLQTLWDAYQQWDKLAIAGGKVTLLWQDATPPNWLSPGLSENLGAYDLGSQLVWIDRPGQTPRGLNYSIRRSFLEQIGGFDRSLGRVGSNLLSNEELHMTEQALRQGWKVAYLPDAEVAHHVAPDRLSRQWFLRRGWWQGISECYREQLAGTSGMPQLARGTERLLRGLYRSLQHFNDPAQRFDNFTYACGQLGYLKAAIGGMLGEARGQESKGARGQGSRRAGDKAF